MIILASKDLDKHGISHQSSSQLVFKGRIFTKGQTFAAHLRDIAIELAQENLTLGQPCIVIDYDSHVTLWRVPRTSVRALSPVPSSKAKDRKASKPNAASGKRTKNERSLWSRPVRLR